MPWKVIDVVNERMRFVLRLEDGERMSELCREFGISRKTGYKIYSRFQDLGPAGLYDESRAPKRQWQQTPREIEDLIVKLRKRHVTWGPDLQDVESAVRGPSRPSWPSGHLDVLSGRQESEAAMRRASSTSRVSMVSDIAQPTTRREYRSSNTAR